MTLIDRGLITVESRQRSSIEPRSVADLADSIKRVGLLNRPVVESLPDGTFRLTAGETRLRAIDSLAKDSVSFFCGTEIVEPGFVPVTMTGERSSLSRAEAEFDENFVRTQPDWKDRLAALTSIHKLRQDANPLHTQLATVKELVAKNVASIGGETGESATGALRRELHSALLVEKHLSDPIIAKARSLKEAEQLALKREDDQVQSELIRRRRVHADSHAKVRIIHGDLFEELSQLADASVDLILSDPPYGINAHTFHKGDRSGAADSHGGAAAVNLHAYSDTPEEARKIYLHLLKEGWRVAKPKANIILFIGFRHFDWLLAQSRALGWTPWEYPVIWQKSESEGLITGWGRHGWIRTYDVIFHATKGQRGLIGPSVDILRFNRVGRAERVYSAEKPIDLMKKLIELSTLPGDMVLDPCAGSGSTLIAARDLKRSALGIELDRNIVDLAEVRLAGEEENVNVMEN